MKNLFKKVFLLTIFCAIITIGTGLCGENISAATLDEWIEQERNNIGNVKMTSEFLDSDILKISVKAEEITLPVIGVAYHLKYDTAKLKFLSYQPGDFLERGGDPFYLVEDAPDKNKIIFGETLRREDKFPSGSGIICEFYFQITKDDLFEFSFEKNSVSILDTVRQDLSDINWQILTIDREHPEGFFENSDSEEIFSQELTPQNFTKTSVNFSNNLIFISVLLLIFLVILLLILRKNKKQKNDATPCQF